jgi:DNA-binding response OmpR family regulator
VVEDEGGVALLLEDMLCDLGFEIGRSVAHLGDALEAARSEAFDIAIIDVNLGGEASFPVARILAERGTPFSFSTGYGMSVLPEEFINRPVLAKPYTAEQLRSVIGGLLK